MKIMFFLCIVATTFESVFPYNKVIRQPKCMYLADVGPCEDQIKVYGYDYLTNRCVHFFYGGCGGNPNRFSSMKECMTECHVEGEESAEDEIYLLDDIYVKNEL